MGAFIAVCNLCCESLQFVNISPWVVA